MVSLVQVENTLFELLGEAYDRCVVEIPDPIKGGRIIAAITEGAPVERVKKQLKKMISPIALPKSYFYLMSFPCLVMEKLILGLYSISALSVYNKRK